MLLWQAVSPTRLPSNQREAIAIPIAISKDHNKVNQNPDTAATSRQQLDNPDHDVSCIETVNSEPS